MLGYAAGSVAVGGLSATAAELAPGNSGLATAVVIGAFGLAGVLLAPIVSDRFVRRRRVDHLGEAQKEQVALADLLRSQLEHANGQLDQRDRDIRAANKEIRELRIAIDRLVRREPQP